MYCFSFLSIGRDITEKIKSYYLNLLCPKSYEFIDGIIFQ
jgi:hypothetical protein